MKCFWETVVYVHQTRVNGIHYGGGAFNNAQDYPPESASIYVHPSSLYSFNDRWVQITLHKNI